MRVLVQSNFSWEWPFACSHPTKALLHSAVFIKASNYVAKLCCSSARSLCTRSSSSGSSSGTTDSLLDELVNYEKYGIPPAAGTAASSRFDLGRMHRLLSALGNPHLGLKAVHLAGSKGKGSTATLLAHILAAAGLRPGLYTSPHLISLEERIAVGLPAGTAASLRPRPVPPDDLAFLIGLHADALRRRVAEEAGALSHFEVVTALAFRYFADCSVDIAVLETGLGGITDATNVLPPEGLLTAIITGLELEHVGALGGSLESIARAKAGIVRSGRPLVLARQRHPEVEEVVRSETEARGCGPLLRAQDWVRVQSYGMEIDPHGRGQAVREHLSLELLPGVENLITNTSTISGSPNSGSSWGKERSRGGGDGGPGQVLDVRVGLVGPHQHDNVAAAVTASQVLRRQGWLIPDDALVAGLRESHLPGRFQVVKMPGPDGPFVVLDGAHTANSAVALTASMRAAFPDDVTGPLARNRVVGAATTSSQGSNGGGPGSGGTPTGGGSSSGIQPVVMILAMADDKDHRGVVAALRDLQPRVAIFTSVPIAGSFLRSAAPGTLAGQWQAAAILAPPSQRPFRCRELVQASLGAAFEKARQELRGARIAMSSGRVSPPPPGVILVTGSLHIVAEAHKLPELQPLLKAD